MYIVQPTPLFERVKNKLKKKYPRIEKDYADLVKNLKQGNFLGDELQDFSNDVYKVRVGSIDQKKGKCGGFRIIYYVITKNETVYMLSIYAKAQQEDLTNLQKKKIKEIIELLK